MFASNGLMKLLELMVNGLWFEAIYLLLSVLVINVDISGYQLKKKTR